MERKKHYYTSITRRLLIAFFCLSIVPIVGFAWIMKAYVEETNIVKLQELAKNTTEQRSEAIAIFLKDRISLLNTLVHLHSQEYFFDQKNLASLFLALDPDGEIVDLLVVDKQGQQRTYAGPYSEIITGKQYAEANWLKETLLQGIHVSDIFLGYRNVPHFVIAVTSPLKDFVLRATINSAMFNSLLHSARLGPHGDAFLVNKNGELQTPSLSDKNSHTSEMNQLLTYGKEQNTLITASNIFTSSWLNSNHWMLLLRAHIADSLGYYLQIRNRIIMIVAVICIVSLAAATFTSFSISRNLELADKEHTATSLQLVQVEKMATVGRLAAGIAHEINNPLQLITNQAGWIAELLEEEDKDSVTNLSEYTKSVQQIKYHVRRAGTITHRLLGFSRKIDKQETAHQINDLIEEAVSFVTREASYKGIAIDLNFAGDLPCTVIDASQLQQVILNLVNNSIDAIKENGRIIISTMLEQANTIIISIADSGSGIPDEYLKQIFDPFFTTKDPGKGTGLGLYISFDIIKKLGGAIKAKNQKNSGAVFTISLPVIAAHT